MARKKIDREFIGNSVDIAKRRIFFSTCDTTTDDHEINPVSVGEVVKSIKTMEDVNPKKPIEIYMNSYGGDVYAAFFLIDVILSSPCQFKFFGGGAIMSAASLIMCACDERYIYPNTTVMVHASNNPSTSDHIVDSSINLAEAQRVFSNMVKFYQTNTRMPENFWRDICSRDIFLSADEAIMLGMADQIIERKKRGNLRQKRSHQLSKGPSVRAMKNLIKSLYSRISLDTNKVKDFNIITPSVEESDPDIVIDTESEDTIAVSDLVTQNDD